ncbi:MAG: VWA domain-containing protein [Acidobacteriaceae bacterium]|nr:VWA domain-containing protein [Acidobacteriaceae bacterium]
MLKRWDVALLAVLVFVTAIFIVHPGAQRPQHSLYVSALDQDGNPVQSLSETNVAIREDRVPREVVSIVPATEPMQVALLVDNSQASQNYIRDYREAFAAFITELGNDPSDAHHEISIVTVGERPTINTDHTLDLERAKQGAGRIFATPGSGSYLLNGIIEVSQGLTKRNATRPVIVAVTTNGPEYSDRMYQTVLDPLKASGATFHLVLIGQPLNMNIDRNTVFDRGTKETGGRYETVLASSGLTMRMRQLGRELTHQWKVTYVRPESLIQPEQITVTSATPGLTVRGTPVKEARSTK